MALMSNPNVLSVTDLMDGVQSSGGCGCGCAGDCSKAADNIGMGAAASMSGIASLGGVGAIDWDTSAWWDTGVNPFPTTAQATNPGYSWNDVFKQGAGVGFSVFKDIFGGPRPGTYITSGPGGSSYQRLPSNSPSASFNLGLSPPGMGSGIGSLLVLGLVGIVAVKMINK